MARLDQSGWIHTVIIHMCLILRVFNVQRMNKGHSVRMNTVCAKVWGVMHLLFEHLKLPSQVLTRT